MEKVKWDDIKNNYNAENSILNHLDLDDMYVIHLFFGRFELECALLKDGSNATEITDFETNYITESNKAVYDESGTPFSRYAIIEKGKAYLAQYMQIHTSDLVKGVYIEDHNGVKETQHFAKFFDVNNIELTTQATIDTDCVKSVFTIKPEIDYSIVKGEIAQHTTPSTSVRVHTVIGMLDPNGNQIAVTPFIKNLDLQYLHPARDIETDGKAPKKLNQTIVGAPYDANQVQVVVFHDAGLKHNIQVSMEYYR